MNTAQRHLAAIESGRIEKTNVIGIRKALAHVDRIRAGWSGNRSAVTPAEADAIEAALRRHHPTVTGELHTSGLKVLRNPRYKSRWTPQQRAMIDAPHIRFDLIRFDRENFGQGDIVVPVYRMVTFAGCFNFRVVSWQSGGNGPEVVS